MPPKTADASARTTTPPSPETSPLSRPAPAPVPTIVQVIDRVGDIVGVITIGLLCSAGRIDGLAAVFAIGALLGVQTGVRSIGARATGTGLGAVGLLLVGGLSLFGPERAHQAVDAAASITGP